MFDRFLDWLMEIWRSCITLSFPAGVGGGVGCDGVLAMFAEVSPAGADISWPARIASHHLRLSSEGCSNSAGLAEMD